MRTLLTVLLGFGLAIPAVARTQSTDPQNPPPPAQNPAPAPVAAPAPKPAKPASSEKSAQMFYGGGVGLAFGDVRYVELSPMVGWRFSPQFGTGVSLMYRWREDTRWASSPSYTDWGGSLFARYRFPGKLFVQAEYDYTDYEYQTTLTTTKRQGYSGYLAGAGYSVPMGKGASAFVLALYDFAYSNSSNSPYASPWTIRAGVSVGF